MDDQLELDAIQVGVERQCTLILEGGLPSRVDDPVGFMVSRLVSMQLAHMKSVTLLHRAQMNGQARIIVRVMLEGYGLMRSAANKPELAVNWRAFALVGDLRTLRQRQSASTLEESEAQYLATIERKLRPLLDGHARGLLKKAAKAALDECIDPMAIIANHESYISKTWTVNEGKPASVVNLLNDLNPDMRLGDVYHEFSKHVHWDVHSILHYIAPSKGGLQLDPTSVPMEGLQARFFALLLTIRTFGLLCAHFTLSEREGKLGALEHQLNDYAKRSL